MLLVATVCGRTIRHSQYLSLIPVIVGCLIQWPTLLTITVAPFMIARYILLPQEEDHGVTIAAGRIYTASNKASRSPEIHSRLLPCARARDRVFFLMFAPRAKGKKEQASDGNQAQLTSKNASLSLGNFSSTGFYRLRSFSTSCNKLISRNVPASSGSLSFPSSRKISRNERTALAVR